jgi:hypothetical protein
MAGSLKMGRMDLPGEWGTTFSRLAKLDLRLDLPDTATMRMRTTLLKRRLIGPLQAAGVSRMATLSAQIVI